MRGYFCKTVRTVLPLLLLVCLSASLSFAQLSTATIIGTVKDSTGAVVPDTTATAEWISSTNTISRQVRLALKLVFQYPALFAIDDRGPTARRRS